MTTIEIVSTYDSQVNAATGKMVAKRHQADFEPIRKSGQYTLGWATVGDLRFPAITTPFTLSAKHGGGVSVLTVSDWQSDWSWVDLTDDESLRQMITTGCGKICNPATMGDSDVIANSFIDWDALKKDDSE
ncbi:hypothetical protein [Azospirillum picis]|uniref:Uncharacterized protein n=1 Tax=Azospirillum picis TaxID=488438 RepID=A0ABU0MPJ0_9PROT|nr:hypothetical protein [Azospirillum picis]MBP2301557.1 hypothetical protein [Azospirillum picis]MDQ0535389.1 hypothetical protein [Azospirillum picis]